MVQLDREKTRAKLADQINDMKIAVRNQEKKIEEKLGLQAEQSNRDKAKEQFEAAKRIKN